MSLVRGAPVLLVACIATFSCLPLVHAQQAGTDPSTAGLSGDEEARMRFELGRRYYDTGRFAEAAREFAEAHRLSGRTELLYNLFLAYRDAGDDVHAAETLRAYIPTLEAGERRTQLEARLRVLEQRLAGGGGAEPGGGTASEGGGAAGGGVRTGAAKLLGVTLRSLRYRLQKHALDAGSDNDTELPSGDEARESSMTKVSP